jgi:hypothetical protein
MLAVGDATVFATSAGSIKSYALNTSGNWTSTATWTQSLGVVPSSLAVMNTHAFGGGQSGLTGNVFSVVLDGGQAPTSYPTASPAWNVSIGGQDGGVAVVGLNNSTLFALSIADGGSQTIDTTGEIIKAAPVWGAGGYLYTAGAIAGTIQARQPLNNVIWDFTPGAGALFEASPNLDCARLADGGLASGLPGVLYVAATDGRVYALIVDSRGLDPSAPWPRYQHDSRNTGNPATPITQCP